MGYAKDCGTSVAVAQDELTSYPKDRYGRLLDPEDREWKIGNELLNLTSPYGHLAFACGTEDDFYCFDWAPIETSKGEFVVLHSVINCETSSFIETADYLVMPANTDQDRRAILKAAFGILDQAYEWVYNTEDTHDADGWNQDPHFWIADISESLFGMTFKDPQHPSAEEIDAMREAAFNE
jgi:hypothetical protein